MRLVGNLKWIDVDRLTHLQALRRPAHRLVCCSAGTFMAAMSKHGHCSTQALIRLVDAKRAILQRHHQAAARALMLSPAGERQRCSGHSPRPEQGRINE